MAESTTSTTRTQDAVLAGFDGGSAAREAVFWAAAEAARRGRQLLLARAYERPIRVSELAWTPVGLDPDPDPTRAAHCDYSLRDLAHELQAVHPDLAVSTTARAGHPGKVLTGLVETTGAELVVVGSQKHGPLARLVFGSTAAELVHGLDRPVVVVHGPASTGPVLLGLAGTDTDGQAMEFAFAHADRHDSPLHAVHGAHHGRSPDELAELLTPWRQRYPEVAVHTEVLADKPAQALVERSSDAGLLVVGSHHHNTLHRVLTGSISHTTLYHAACPVAVVPAGRHVATRQQAHAAATR